MRLNEFNEGYSLIELIVSILLLGIILSGSVLGLKSLAQTNPENVIRQLKTELSYYALTAKLEERDAELSLGLKTKELKDENSKRLLKIPKEIQIKEISFGNLNDKSFKIFFRKNGTASAGRIVLSSKNKTCSLIQNIYGATRILCY